MRAFIFSLVAIVAISVLAAAALTLVPMSSSEVFSEHSNVRL
jgi:hypothetical protein